jgi:hypothetical protein
MGKRAIATRRVTRRTIRSVRLSAEQRDRLLMSAAYEGSPHHKRSPGDFGLTPPASPRPDKTLCDEAGVSKVAIARSLLEKAIRAGLVSEDDVGGFPKQMWVLDDSGHVFEVMHGVGGRYHGYPIRRNDPFFDEVVDAWKRLECQSSSST